VVFEASGMPLGEYVQSNIFEPMEMKNSKAPDDTRGAAGIQCSIKDLGNYCLMILSEGTYKGKRILSKKMFKTILIDPVEEPNSRHREYRGICWRVWTLDGAVVSLLHAAHMNGAGGFMQLFPRNGNGYLFISNPPVYDREEFYRYYYGIKHRLIRLCQSMMTDGFKPIDFTADRPSIDQIKLFVGRYRSSDTKSYIDVSISPGGYLTAFKSFNGGTYALVPTSLHTFVYIYPGQTEKGELFDFIMKDKKVVGLGSKEGYFFYEQAQKNK
jgi:hypothetical protein